MCLVCYVTGTYLFWGVCMFLYQELGQKGGSHLTLIFIGLHPPCISPRLCLLELVRVQNFLINLVIYYWNLLCGLSGKITCWNNNNKLQRSSQFNISKAYVLSFQMGMGAYDPQRYSNKWSKIITILNLSMESVELLMTGIDTGNPMLLCTNMYFYLLACN